MQMNIAGRVSTIVANQFSLPADELRIGAQLESEYRMDDLDLVEITMTVEDEFGIEIDDDQMNAFKTTQHIIDCVAQKV